MPLGLKNLDESVEQFVTDLNGAAQDPAYFDSGWEVVQTVNYVFSLATYRCGLYEYPDLSPLSVDPNDPWGPPVDGWPGLPNGGSGCVYLGYSDWTIPINFWEFDPSGFSTAAVNVYFRLRNYVNLTGSFTISSADSAAVKNEFEALFGVNFDSSPSPDAVKIEPKTQRLPTTGYLLRVGLWVRVANIIGGILYWTDTTDDDENFNILTHYGYWADVKKFARGLNPSSYATDEPLVNGPTAQQLYALPPKGPSDPPPDGFYSVVVEYGVPKQGFTEVQRTFTDYGITVTRDGGGGTRIICPSVPGPVPSPGHFPFLLILEWMPMENEDDQDYRANEEFFAPISGRLVQFASRFNLRLDKYHRGSSNWDFAFEHPLGGVGLLQVMKSSDDCLVLACNWTLDDRPAGVRHTRSTEPFGMNRDDPNLCGVLETMLRDMVSWRKDNWSRVIAGFKDLWARHPEAALGYNQPLPKPSL